MTLNPFKIIRRQREQIALLKQALERCGRIVERNLYHQHEKIADVPFIAKTTLAIVELEPKK